MGYAVKNHDELCWTGNEPAVRDFDLGAALRSDRIEFWYQPKIDLKLKRLMGVEILARYRMPGRVVLARDLIEHASSDAILALTEKALVSALKTGANLSEIGIDIRIAVNTNVMALRTLPVADLVKQYRPNGGKSLGLVFDISESEVCRNFEEVVEISTRMRCEGFSIAVDDFGSSLMQRGKTNLWNSAQTIGKLRSGEFSELKLDRELVRECGNDRQRQDICEHFIGLAHSFGSKAVGIGIERLDEMKRLQELNCDIGQGYLFGHPMSEEDFLVLLWNRAIRRGLKPKAEKPKRVPYVPAKRLTRSRSRPQWAH